MSLADSKQSVINVKVVPAVTVISMARQPVALYDLRMLLRVLSVLLVAFLLSGCFPAGRSDSSNIWGESRQQPFKYTTISVSSIPSGARVFSVTSDGGVGEYLGTTPFEMQVSLRCEYYQQDHFIIGLHNTHIADAWSASPGGCVIVGSMTNTTVNLKLNCFAAKDGYQQKTVHGQTVITARFTPGTKGNTQGILSVPKGSITIPLQANVSPASEVAGKPEQQQQQQQQQTVIVGNTEKDDDTGRVSIMSDVDDAEIYIDGAFVGNAPATLNLTVGIHIIEVRHGEHIFKRNVRILKDGDVTLRAKFD